MNNEEIIAAVIKKQVEDAENKKLQDLVKQGVLNKEEIKDIDPIVTAGKQFIQETVPEQLRGQVLSDASKITEGDERNPTARMIGYSAAQIPLLLPIGGTSKLSKEIVSKLPKEISPIIKESIPIVDKKLVNKELVKDIVKKTQENRLENLISEQQKLGELNKDAVKLTPEHEKKYRDLLENITNIRKKDIPLTDTTLIAKNPDTGEWETVVAEVESHIPFSALTPGKGSNAIRLESGKVLLPNEVEGKTMVKLLSRKDPEAYKKIVGKIKP